MQVEFKVIGSLTMRQFFYLIITAVAAAGVYRSGLPSFFRVPTAGIIALAGLAVAFLPIEERGLDQWVVNFFRSIYQPSQRIWRKEAEALAYFLYENAQILKSQLLAVAPTASRRKLEQYLEHETGVKTAEPFEDREEEYIKKVRDAFLTIDTQVAPVQTVHIYTPTAVQTPVPPMPPPAPVLPPPPKPPQEIKPPMEQIKPAPIVAPPPPPPEPKPAEEAPESKPPTIQQERVREYITQETVTPDRLSGRRFFRLSKTQGEIILPVKGERIIRTTKEKLEEDLNKRANQLMDLVEKIRKGHLKDKPTPSPIQESSQRIIPEPQRTVSPPSSPEVAAKDTVDQMRTENVRLQSEIEDLKKKALEPQKSDEERRVINDQVEKLQAEKSKADTLISELQNKLTEMEQKLKTLEFQQSVAIKPPEPPKMPVIPVEEAQPKPIEPPQKAVFSSATPTTTTPNLINGIVRGKEGKLLDGAVVIIKDTRGDTVRALKTNQLGQFTITTPVANGSYVIEISKDTLKFSNFSVEVKGEVLPPIEFIGKL